MRSYIFIIIFLILGKFSSGQVKIKFFNKTKFNVDSFYFQGKYIGQLKRDTILDQQFTSYFTLFSFASGKIGGMRTTLPRNKCGTGMEEIKDTTIYLDVLLKEWGKDQYVLQIQYHK